MVELQWLSTRIHRVHVEDKDLVDVSDVPFFFSSERGKGESEAPGGP